MRRLRRWLFNALATLSLLMFAVTSVFWVRSYWAEDTLFLQRDEWLFETVSTRGEIGERFDFNVGHLGHDFDFYSKPLDSMFFIYPVVPAESDFTWHIAFWGFAILMDGRPGQLVRLAAPDWFLLILFAIAPVKRLRQAHGLRKIRTQGLCKKCGYDLRATPDMCPECGTPTQ